MSEDRQKALRLLHEGQRRGVSIKAIAALIGICSRTLRRWGKACGSAFWGRRKEARDRNHQRCAIC